MDILVAHLNKEKLFRDAVKKRIQYKHIPFTPDSAPKRTFMIQTVSKTPIKVITTINEKKETHNYASRGDYIVTGPLREQYVIKPDKFFLLYNVRDQVAEPRCIIRKVAKFSKSIADKLKLPSHISFTAPWGEEMVINTGDFIVKDKSGYYSIAASAFRQTYRFNDRC